MSLKELTSELRSKLQEDWKSFFKKPSQEEPELPQPDLSAVTNPTLKPMKSPGTKNWQVQAPDYGESPNTEFAQAKRSANVTKVQTPKLPSGGISQNNLPTKQFNRALAPTNPQIEPKTTKYVGAVPDFGDEDDTSVDLTKTKQVGPLPTTRKRF